MILSIVFNDDDVKPRKELVSGNAGNLLSEDCPLLGLKDSSQVLVPNKPLD